MNNVAPAVTLTDPGDAPPPAEGHVFRFSAAVAHRAGADAQLYTWQLTNRPSHPSASRG